MKTDNREAGFTLIELLIVIAIFGLAIAGIYQAFQSQNKSYAIQNQVAEIQQNLRAALYLLEREIRMAGYDPSGKAEAGITEWTAGAITFEVHNDATGAFDTIRYALNGTKLGRDTGGGLQPVIENVDALNFLYFDADGNPAGSADGIQTVEVTMVVRASRKDPLYEDRNVYTNQAGDTILDLSGATGDTVRFRRRMLTARIKCRNLALN